MSGGTLSYFQGSVRAQKIVQEKRPKWHQKDFSRAEALWGFLPLVTLGSQREAGAVLGAETILVIVRATSEHR
jgi:hypothetical protein